MRRVTILLILLTTVGALAVAGQTRRPRTPPRPTTSKQPAPAGSATKYSLFLHSSDKHKGLTCNACHKVPTDWTAKRDFPDVADFPDHSACVRCHRQQFFTRQAFAGAGPAICTVCHARNSPRDDARFGFGNPNNANQTMKPRDERQFAIEFPHDKHQNVIARLSPRPTNQNARMVRALFTIPDDQKIDYNNCTICHQPNNNLKIAPPTPAANAAGEPNRLYKTMPHAHDACFACHWKNEKPTADDCAGCHRPPVPSFVALGSPKRISAMFSHEGGKGGHVAECTTCHINITRSSTLKGLTPDVPITICATCHKDSKKTTYPNIVTIEMEFDSFKKNGNCGYCHAADVGKRKAPPSHEAAVQ